MITGRVSDLPYASLPLNYDSDIVRILQYSEINTEWLDRRCTIRDFILPHVDEIDPHPQYLMPEELPQTLVGWFTSVLHSTETGYQYTSVKPTTPEQTISAPVPGDNTLVATWWRENAYTQDVSYFEVESRIMLEVGGISVPSASAEIYCKINAKLPDTSVIELATTGILPIAETRAIYALTGSIAGPIDLPAGTLVNVELYANKVGAGPTPTLDVYVEGLDVSRIITFLPIPAYPAPHAISHDPGESDSINGTYPTKSQTLTAFSGALYSGLALSAENVPFPDITLAYQRIDVFDEIAIPSERGVVANIANSSLYVQTPGVYVLSIFLSFEHDEVNQGRQIYYRVYNITDGVPGRGSAIFIGRNQPGTSVGASILLEVANVNKEYVLEIGGGDGVASVVFDNAEYALYSVGEFRGNL